MLRTNLILVLGLLAGQGFAQSSDPEAVSPIVYEGGAASDCVNADGTPCVAEADARAAYDSVDYSGDGYPAYDPTDYAYYSSPFYLGVSLWPWGYWGSPYYGYGYGYVGWGFGYGWPYWGYPGWGWGWGCCGYWGHYYAWNGDHWHGGWHDGHGHDGWHDGHGHDGWHDGHGHDGNWHGNGSNPGPYRYAGNGMYSNGGNRVAPGTTLRMNDNVNRAALASHATADRSNTANFAHAAAPRANTAFSAQRATLPSAAYYSAAQRSYTAQRAASASTARMPSSLTGARAATSFDGSAVRGAQFGPNSHVVGVHADPNHVTSMPSHGYATNRGTAAQTRSYAYAQHGGYAGPHGYAAPQQHYGAAPYHVPSYTHGGAGSGYMPRGGVPYAHGPSGGYAHMGPSGGGSHGPSGGGGSSHGGGGGGSHGGGGGGHH